MGLLNLFRKSAPESKPMTTADLANVLAGVDTAADSGVYVSNQSALRYLTVLSCIRVIAESVGMLPLNIYQRKGEARELATNNPLFGVLSVQPNDYQTATEFWEMAVSHLAWRGNFFAYKVLGVDGRLLELIPINPDSVTVEQLTDYRLRYYVTFQNGEGGVFENGEIFHVKRLSLDGVTGLNPISYARESLGLGIATQKHGARLFKNGARPGGVLSTDQVLKDDSFTRVSESWNESYGGADNAHKTAILEAGLKYQPIGMTNEDSQFLETRKYQRSEICGFFRVPPHMIGDLEKATFSNIEHQSLQFVTHTLGPYLAAIESRIHSDLVLPRNKGRVFARFDVTELLRGDMAGRSAYYNSMVNLGAMSPNEIRTREGMNPRTGGDIYLTPLNMAVNGKNPEPEPEPTPEPQPNEDQETTETV